MLIQFTCACYFVTGDLLDERTAIVEGYNSYFSFSKGRSGYSGEWCLVLLFGFPIE